jgi:hypothetical protein
MAAWGLPNRFPKAKTNAGSWQQVMKSYKTQ